MNQRWRMPDDGAGHYRALKCKLHAAGRCRDSSSGSHYRTAARLIRIAHINRNDASRLLSIYLNSRVRLSDKTVNEIISLYNTLPIIDIAKPSSIMVIDQETAGIDRESHF